MSECILCHKKGVFVHTSSDGLCHTCAQNYQIDIDTGIIFSKEEQDYADNKAQGMWHQNLIGDRIVDMNCLKLQGIASYAISSKQYDLAKRLLALSEARATNEVDLHFCYNWWIKLLYMQREKKECLMKCIEYCKKDIYLWETVSCDPFFKGHETVVPSFTQLAIIYEKAGNYSEAIKINERALSYGTISRHDSYKKRIARIRNKLNASTIT